MGTFSGTGILDLPVATILTVHTHDALDKQRTEADGAETQASAGICILPGMARVAIEAQDSTKQAGLTKCCGHPANSLS